MIRTTFHRITLATTVAAIGFASLAVAPGPAAAAEFSAPGRVVEQKCVGSGESHKCLYCVYGDGIKDCFWVKVPEKPKSSRPAGSLVAPDGGSTATLAR